MTDVSHRHGNQLDNYKGPERASEFYAMPHIKEIIDEVVTALRENPDAHIVPYRKEFQVRFGQGVRKRCSIRAIVYEAMGLEIPERGFGFPSCGVRGCVNPKCQTFFNPKNTQSFSRPLTNPTKGRPAFKIVEAPAHDAL